MWTPHGAAAAATAVESLQAELKTSGKPTADDAGAAASDGAVSGDRVDAHRPEGSPQGTPRSRAESAGRRRAEWRRRGLRGPPGVGAKPSFPITMRDHLDLAQARVARCVAPHKTSGSQFVYRLATWHSSR